MPLLRKGILVPSDGVDFSQPATFISDRSGFPQNLRVINKDLCKRPGKSLYGSAAISGGQIMGLGVLEMASLKYLVRASKTALEKYNSTTEAWEAIAATAFTGGDEDFFSFATVTESELLIITNGYDRIRKWTGSGNNAVLGGNPPLAKYCAYLSPYLLLAHTDDGASVKPWEVVWCDTDGPETWVGGNSGSRLLSDEASAIQNIMKLNEYISAYKENSIYLGYKVDPPDIFQFNCVRTGMGLASPRAVADAEGIHYFMGLNDFYAWNGAGIPQSIGGAVESRVFSTIDREKIKRCFAVHVKNLKEVWFFVVPSGDTWPTQVWKYNYRTGFWYLDTCSSLTAAIAWKKIATQTWDDDTPGSWDEAVDFWDAGDSVKDWEEAVFGDANGYASRLDYNTTNDLGLAVAGVFETKDYTGDVLEFNKRWLQMDIWAKGSSGAKLYIDYSIDEGSTWTTIPATSSTVAYLTLTESMQRFRIYFDVVADKIRFRFRNSESGENFFLRNFYPYYLAREEAGR